MGSDNTSQDAEDPPESTSDNKQSSPARQRGRKPTPLPKAYQAVHAGYVELLANTPLDADTRRAYASRVRGYLAWLADSATDTTILDTPALHDGAVRDYRAHLQTVARRKPATINTTLAAISDFYTRTGRGTPQVRRLELPQQAPRALDTKTSIQWLRSVERWLNPRDRVLALLPFYAGLRLGEAITLDLADVQLSARKGTIIVRSGKGNRYREIPTHPTLRDNLATWIDDERPHWPDATDNPALLLNRRGGRLSARAADQILGAIAKDAKIDEFTPHVLRHTFGTRLVRQGHDLVVVAELLGHARLDQTRRYSLPTQIDRQRAINSLLTDY
jgi:site-specific recombinase XerD